MNNSRKSFLVLAAWFGILTGVLESVAYLRFPHLENPDLPWIAVLFATTVFVVFGVFLAAIAKPSPTVMTLVSFIFGLVMFYNVATVGVLDHRERLILRALAIVFACGAAYVTWRFPAKVQRFHARSLVWVALLAVIYTGVPAVVRAVHERRQIANTSTTQSTPNVVMIIVDTLRADHLSTYGYARQTSPNITEFASHGVMFRNAISAASWTLPSHASIVTGRLPHEHGADRPDSYLDARFPTVAEAFSARGYHTAAFSANWWLFARRLGFGRGFMHFQDFNSVASAVVQTNLGQRMRNVILKVDASMAPLGRSRAASINHDIFRWIDRHPGPFFIMANYMDVHEPYMPPLSCFHQYSKLPRPSGQVFLGNPKNDDLTPAEVQDEVDAYDASIRCMDADFASLVDGLKQRGLMNNTVVVLTSDHGDEFNEHGLMSHESTLYRELIHVPLIVVGPGVPAGVTVDRPVSLMNLPTTLLALSGADGKSFPGVPLNLAWNKSQNVIWADPVSELAQLPTEPRAPNYYSALQSVVTPEWQLIIGGKKGKELYRWPKDKLELHDLASGNETMAASLTDELHRAENGETAAPPVARSDAPTAITPTSQKKNPRSPVIHDERTDRDRNNEYLKALGYIPN